MPTETRLNVLPPQEEACTSCVCTTPPPADCDPATPCFPVYPETSADATAGPAEHELELLCGVER
jgi:hypothetical protein